MLAWRLIDISVAAFGKPAVIVAGVGLDTIVTCLTALDDAVAAGIEHHGMLAVDADGTTVPPISARQDASTAATLSFRRAI